MKLRIILILSLLFLLASQVFALEQTVIKNTLLSRTVSGTLGILKSSKLEAYGVQMLDGPSVEFMIDIEHKGGITTLLPGDFDIMDVKTSEVNKISKTSIIMFCRNSDIPLKISVDYSSDLKTQYMQKSITIDPCKKPADAVIKRVTLEYFRLTNAFMPMAPVNRYLPEPEDDAGAETLEIRNKFSFDGSSDFAALDPKTNKGLIIISEPQRARVAVTSRRFVTVNEDVDVPLGKGYETAKITIGTAEGSPEDVYKQYREYLLNSRCAAFGSSKQLVAFKEKFDAYFKVCQYISISPETKGIDAEGRIAGNRGFIILFNSSNKPQKLALPLDDPNVELKGDVKLSDWSSLNSSSDMGNAGVGDKIEVEIEPGSMKIIGVNIAGE